MTKASTGAIARAKDKSDRMSAMEMLASTKALQRRKGRLMRLKPRDTIARGLTNPSHSKDS